MGDTVRGSVHNGHCPTRDPLFGTGIRLTGAWASHVTDAVRAGFWSTVRTAPGLVRFAFSTAWSADRPAVGAAAVAHLAHAATGALGLVAVNRVLAGLLASGPTRERVTAAVPALLVVGALAAVGSLARAVSTAAEGRLGPKVQRFAEERLLERVARAELAALDDGALHRSLAGARLGIRATEQLVATVLSSTGALVGLLAMTGVLGALHPLLVPLLVLAVVPHGWKAMTVARWEHRSAVRSLNPTRQKEVLADALVERGAQAEEIRVHGLAGFLLDHYRRLATGLEAERARLARARAGAGIVADAAGGLGRVLAYVALGWLLTAGVVALATAGTAVIAISRVTSELTVLLLQVNGFYTHGLFAADYLDTVREVGARAIPTGGLRPGVPDHIALRDVRYTYPGADRPALRGVDLSLRRGEVIALVGTNGSGKSTLARLIAGLHRPEHGTITWDGVDTADLDRDLLFARIGWISQDFPRWPFTARVNTTLGLPLCEKRLADAADFADLGAIVDGLPHGWETLLAKEFQGGTTLSGGQWQRLALARARYRDAPLLICDEPTAALDPVTEIESFRRLMGLARAHGRTVVLITHRLGSVCAADRIYVLDDGRVVDSGTHEDLLARGGLFADMFRAQQEQYDRSAR